MSLYIRLLRRKAEGLRTASGLSLALYTDPGRALGDVAWSMYMCFIGYGEITRGDGEGVEERCSVGGRGL
jgi:hypothetical protein